MKWFSFTCTENRSPNTSINDTVLYVFLLVSWRTSTPYRSQASPPFTTTPLPSLCSPHLCSLLWVLSPNPGQQANKNVTTAQPRPPGGHTSTLPPHPWTSRLPSCVPSPGGQGGSSPIAGLLNSPLDPACWLLVFPSLCGLLLLNSSLKCSSFPVLNTLISSVSVVSTANVSLENLTVDIPILISLWRAGREHPAVPVMLPMSVPRAPCRAEPLHVVDTSRWCVVPLVLTPPPTSLGRPVTTVTVRWEGVMPPQPIPDLPCKGTASLCCGRLEPATE